MKVIFEITKAQFGIAKLEVVGSYENDYYTRTGNSTSFITRPDETGNEIRLVHERRVKALESYPAKAFIWQGNWGHLTDITGYVYDNTLGYYGYSTCARNMWLVWKEDGKYYCGYVGARSVCGFPFEIDEGQKPLVYETSSPSDMYWNETQSGYLKRNRKAALAWFAEHGEPEWAGSGQNELDAWGYYSKAEGESEWRQAVTHHTFKDSSEAESYLLRITRNKKIVPVEFDIKTKTAWNLLDEKVQQRLLKWGA